MENSWPYFVTELTKLSAQLNSRERQRQALQFAALGTASVPTASGLSNLIQKGKISPYTTKGRWLAGTAVAGLISGAALPYIQHALERKAQDTAASRIRKARMRKALADFKKQR